MTQLILNDHEKISEDMFFVFKKACSYFTATLKEGYLETSKIISQDQEVVKIKTDNYTRDLILLIEKVKDHHKGNVVTYELDEISLIAAIIHIFKLKSEPVNQIVGRIFNVDVRYVSVFDEVIDNYEKELAILQSFENLSRKFSRRSF